MAWRMGSLGAFSLAKEVAPYMLARGSGTIIYTSATAAYRGNAGQHAHTAAMAGRRHLAQSLNNELGKTLLSRAGCHGGVSRRLLGFHAGTLARWHAGMLIIHSKKYIKTKHADMHMHHGTSMTVVYPRRSARHPRRARQRGWDGQRARDAGQNDARDV